MYRAPDRDPDQAIDRNDPEGFALITETRSVHLPVGRSTIRFEGVAGNIFPETAIVAGLPQDVREKNLDADLLSPRSLYDRALGRRVMVRRTDLATGKTSERQATIRSGADGAAVVQVAGGYEALHCGGLPEALIYDGVPAGLSPKPTLSVQTDSPVARDVTLTLSYLAGGFDWQADYVVQMRPDGRRADLFAWITLASSDVTSFADAGTQVVAGKPNRTADWSDFGQYGNAGLALKCWPAPQYGSIPKGLPTPMMESADIVVTAVRRTASFMLSPTHVAQLEELGDFKLYRIADPVTVALKAQKQVALLSREAVPLTAVYVSQVFDREVTDPVLTLRGKNRVSDKLGLSLPAGKVVVFEQGDTRPILIGESSIDDKAIGEDVELKLTQTVGVSATLVRIAKRLDVSTFTLTVTNANPWPISYEAKIERLDAKMTTKSGKIGRRDGRAIWATTVPANGEASLIYSVGQ